MRRLYYWMFVRLRFTKNHRLIAMDLSRPKELDADPKEFNK